MNRTLLKFGQPAFSPTSVLINVDEGAEPSRLLSTLDAINTEMGIARNVTRAVVSTLGWANDHHTRSWEGVGWNQIIVWPRPISIFKLSAVRNLMRQGNALIIPWPIGGPIAIHAGGL